MASRSENGKRNTRKRYTMEFKMQGLSLLDANCGVFNKTAAELGVSHNTLRHWYNMYGDGLDKHGRAAEVAQRVSEKATLNKVSIMDSVHEAKQLILNRMIEIIPTERNLNNLQQAYKSLCVADGTIPPEKEGVASQSITLIESLTQNFKDYESKTPITIVGDPEE